MFDRSISTPFHTLNHPSPFLRKTYKQCRRRIHQNITTPYVLVQVGESDKSPDVQRNPVENISSPSIGNARSVLSQGNAVGILSFSVESTVKFLQRMINWSSKEGKDCPPFLVCSDPSLKKRVLGNEDHDQLVADLHHKREFLEQGGARCIVMPCHALHSWHGEISKEGSVPFLHVGDCVAEDLKEARLKPLEAGSPLRIGLLAEDVSSVGKCYQEKLRNKGFEVVLPDKATMEHIVLPAMEALNRKDKEGARNLVRIALQLLLIRAVNTVILASDKMLELLPRDDPLLRKCIDPMDALARSTIRWAQSVEKGS